MGRKSGSLSLGMCKAAGATVAVLPEEFPERTTLASVTDTIVGSIVKQRSLGREYGVAVVAEGIAERIGDDVFNSAGNLGRDSFGHVPLADVPLGLILRDAVRKRLSEIGVNSVIHTKDIGYELRCAKPVPFDLDYTRTLGFGAVRYLVGGGSGALIALSGGRVEPIKLEDLLDPSTGRIRTRQVDTSSQAYRVARDYMVRLEPPDFGNPEHLAELAAQTNLKPDEFREPVRIRRAGLVRRDALNERGPPLSNVPLSLEKIWRRPTFEGPCGPTIIGAGGLNCRVRDGNGWDPAAMGARNLDPAAMASRSSSRSRRETCKAVQRRTSKCHESVA